MRSVACELCGFQLVALPSPVEEEAFVSSFLNLEGRFCWITWMDGPKCAMIDR